MSVKNVPEISRINFFEGEDVVQIFGENFTKDTKLYVWQGRNDSEAVNEILDFSKGDGGRGQKEEFNKNRTVDFDELDTVISALNDITPENAKCFDADEVFEHCIYFGDKEPECIDGEWGPRIPGGTSVFWLENENGMSKPAVANRPEIWNISFDQINRGERITIFGEALGNPVHFSDGGNAPKRAAIKNIETGECFKLDSAATTGYTFDIHKHMAEYYVPMEAPLGKYNIYVHSGTGGRFGWSEPYQFEIVEDNSLNNYFRTKWNRSSDACPEMPKCEIRTIYNDDPSPLADYAEKIQSAIDSLENGGLVLLTSGTFPISKTISIKPGVVVLGAGSSTVIKAAEGRDFDGNIILDSVFSAKPAKLRGWANDWRELYIKSRTGTGVRLCTNSGIEGVKIEMGGGINIGMLVADDKIDTVENAFISKVVVESYGVSRFAKKDRSMSVNSGLLVGAKTKDLVVWGCTFAATEPIYILPSRHTFAKIMNNDFLCRPRQVNETMLGGLRNSIISGNLFADGRRAFVTNQGFSHNWVYQNRVTGIDRAEGALEAYMSEHGNGEWSGHGVAFGENLRKLDTSVRDPIIPTKAGTAYGGTTGRRDIFYCDGYYYMVYEISTEDLPPHGYGGAYWTHMFARSKDMITWEITEGPQLTQSQTGYGYDGPCWCVVDGELYVYMRNRANNTTAVKLVAKDQ
jgi:hypothetical protein